MPGGLVYTREHRGHEQTPAGRPRRGPRVGAPPREDRHGAMSSLRQAGCIVNQLHLTSRTTVAKTVSKSLAGPNSTGQAPRGAQ